MKISLNWVREFTDIKCSDEELVTKIGAQLGEVEEVTKLGERYKDVVVAKVVSCEKHPNADKLSLCLVDDGGKVKGVKRNSQGLVQVVCGAPNVRRGLTVAWLPPGAIVPSTFDKEKFRLEARDLRGKMSNGMIASGQELAINDDHSGILVLDKKAKPGDSFSDIYKLDDVIVEVENKMFTHRPDLFGMLGLAREIAGIQGIRFRSPEWYLKEIDAFKTTGEPLKLTVKNELPDLVPRFMMLPMGGVSVGKSPILMQSFLSRVGVKPINNIVDITNFTMMLTAQPLHAFDYDKIAQLDGSKSVDIVVRQPKKGETIHLLNGKVVETSAGAIMVATPKHLLAVAGVMGGADTEVDESTKNIILECATFDMYSIRRTSMQNGLFTDAVTRFTKGQSPLQNENVLAYAAAWVKKIADGTVAGAVHDNKHLKGFARVNGYSVHAPVTVTPGFINQRLGLDLTAAQITKLLENVEFAVDHQKTGLKITAPFWRTDIEIAEDIVEEVGRLYGYDHLPLELPVKSISPSPRNAMLDLKRDIRTALSAAGANEVLTYSFVHGNLIEKVGQNKDDAFRLSNALSPDLQYYRMSLTPSLLDKVNTNLRSDMPGDQDNEFALFEINKAHHKDLKGKEGLPEEMELAALVFAADDKTAKRKYSGAPYYMALRYMYHLFSDGLNRGYPRLVPMVDYDQKHEITKVFEPSRSAIIYYNDEAIGVVGEYTASVKKALKLPDFAAGFELEISGFAEAAPAGYSPLAKFPRTVKDMTFKTPIDVPYAKLEQLVGDSLADIGGEELTQSLLPIAIYQDAKAKDDRNITFRLWLAHTNRTFTTEEVNTLLDKVAAQAKTKLKAIRI